MAIVTTFFIVNLFNIAVYSANERKRGSLKTFFITWKLGQRELKTQQTET